jgi:uncharacterized Zn finger protein
VGETIEVVCPNCKTELEKVLIEEDDAILYFCESCGYITEVELDPDE